LLQMHTYIGATFRLVMGTILIYILPDVKITDRAG
jgi:hypothetical protein